jgi:hypothetical protein
MNRRVVCLAGLLLLARNCLAQYGYNYDANYYDDYSLYSAGGFPSVASPMLEPPARPFRTLTLPPMLAWLTSLPAAGYHYDMYEEDDEGLNFNPYTNSYDDAYGDYYFDDVEEEISTCRLGEDGKPKFNGELPVQNNLMESYEGSVG